MAGTAQKAMPVLKSMAYKLVQGVLYCRHRDQPVLDEDWDQMLSEIGRNIDRGGTFKILVRTDSAGPNVVQRAKLNELMTRSAATLQVAVLSGSVIVRGIVTAFSWMRTVQIRAFAPNDYAGALAYLKLKTTAEAAERTMNEIDRKSW